ncbi:MAG: hypothetical protein ABJF28_06410 [Nisaea sp.]|uniref:hypothetical protein n=1 Tax=Nisaea sp. TaxID=2024842 RepID=UPI0032642BEA
MATQVINESTYTEHLAANQTGSVPRSYDTLAATASSAMGVARAKSASLPMEAALQSKLISHLPDALAVEASDEMLVRLEKYRKNGSYASERTSATGSTAVFSGSVAEFDAARRASAALVESNALDWKSARDQQVADHNLTEGLMLRKSVKERDSAEKERKSTLIRSSLQIVGAGVTIIAAGVALKWSMSSPSNSKTSSELLSPGARTGATNPTGPAGTPSTPAASPPSNSSAGLTRPGARADANVTTQTSATTQPNDAFVPAPVSKNASVPQPVAKTAEAPASTASQAKAPGGDGDPGTVDATAKNNFSDKMNPDTARSFERSAKLALMGPTIGAVSQLMNALGELLSMNDREGSRLATADATELGALAEKIRGEGEFERSHAQARIQNGFDPLAKANEALNQVKVDRLRAIANPSA